MKARLFFDPENDEQVKKILAYRTQQQRLDILKQINYFNLYPTKQDVANWQAARLVAIDYIVPDWTDYIRVLDDVMIDGHISGIMQTVKDKLQAREFEIVNASGKVDTEKIRDLFDQEWFYRFMEFYIESLFYPYSLVQLGNLNSHSRYDEMEMIPREHIIPQYSWIKKDVYVTNRVQGSGWYWNEPTFDNYFIFMSGRIIPGIEKLTISHLGMLDKAAYHGLGKKHMLIYWWRFGELYGIPFRHGQTDIRDNLRRKNLEETFKNAGNNQWVITDREDIISLIESKQTGTRNIFRDLMDYSDQQISKAFIGSTAIMDEKSFVGSAEIGERIFQDRQKSILRKFKNIVNNALIPRMIFYGLPVQGYFLKWKNEDVVSYKEKTEAVRVLQTIFDFDAEEMSEMFGFKLTPKEQQTAIQKIETGKVKSVIPEVIELYKGFNSLEHGTHTTADIQ